MWRRDQVEMEMTWEGRGDSDSVRQYGGIEVK
jgi:hypothetical protein